MAVMAKFHTVAAVSYTHLDVYKRQIIEFLITFKLSFIGDTVVWWRSAGSGQLHTKDKTS